MFKREISLNRVRDSITIREGDEKITLYVDSDANTLIHGIMAANKELEALKDDDSEDRKRSAAMAMARAMFGVEQADKLLEFYRGNYGCVITICGMYFGDAKYGLGKKITKAQKKNRR